MKFLKTTTGKILFILAIIGPGIITAMADNDAGGVATYSVAAAQYGYTMLTTLIPMTIVLAVTQEIGARVAIVARKGLGDLIRERYGIRTSLVMFALLTLVNFGVIMQDMGGLKDGLKLFHLNVYIFLPLITLFLLYFVAKASYKRIEKFFFILIPFYLVYVISAYLSKPHWLTANEAVFIPVGGKLGLGYFYTAIAVLGTTVTAWGQFFVHSYYIDKKPKIENLKYHQWEVYAGAISTNVVAYFMMVAVAATLFVHNIPISDASEAAIAIKPFAGQFASALFAVGLIFTGFFGVAVVPLATTYAFSEFFGTKGSLDISFRESKTFYILFTIQVILGLIVTLFPQTELFQFVIFVDFLNGIVLPVIIFFLYRFSNDKQLLGEHINGKVKNYLLVGSGIVIAIASIIGAVGQFFNIQ